MRTLVRYCEAREVMSTKNKLIIDNTDTLDLSAVISTYGT